MNTLDFISLFIIMFSLAIIPSTSVALVITRSITAGIKHGLAVALGIVCADVVFVCLVILGLTFVAETKVVLFSVLQYLGAIYLFWLGITLLSSTDKVSFDVTKASGNKNYMVSFLSGFILTIGDIKAIFFYVSLLPAFVDLSVLKTTDFLMIVFLTLVTVGGVKIAYAFFAINVLALFKGNSIEINAKKIAGFFMLTAASYLFIKT